MESMTFIKHPGAPRVGLVTTETVFNYMLDESNTAVVQFTVVDADTAAADVTIALRTTLSATVARIGNTNDYALTISVSAPFTSQPQCPASGMIGWLARSAVELGLQDWMCRRAHAHNLVSWHPTSCVAV